jgi:hypothetical protein
MGKRTLPSAITESSEFKNLTDKQIYNIEARFRYLDEIIDNIESWLAGSGKDVDVRSFLDDLELDLSVNQNLPHGQSVDFVSSWLIHTSWTFGTNAQSLVHDLSTTLLSKIEQNIPRISSSLDEFKAWLMEQCSAIKIALDDFYNAQTFTGAIAHHIAIDILLINMLAGIYKIRLNKLIM